MAVVGEAHILVRAITTQVKKDIQSGLKGLKGQGTESGEEFGKGFGNGIANQMQYAQKSFSSLMRKGYVLQAGLGALVGTVGALAGGIAALGGAALAAGSSFTVMANGMVAMKVATSVGGMALKGVSQAVSAAGSSAGGAGDSVEDLKNKLEQLRLEARKASLGQKQAALDFEKAKIAFERTADLPAGDLRRRQAAIDLEEAKLNLDNAKQANKEAKDALKDGPKAQGGADPYAGLTKTQKEFAQYLVTIQSKMVLLREAAASSFLPELQRQLQSFIARGFMGTLVKSFGYLSDGLANLTADFSRSFIGTKNMRLLAELFRNVTTTLSGFGSVIGKTFEGFLYYLKNTNPLLNRFVAFLQFKSTRFAENQRNNASSIQAFFKVAGDAAADFGTIFGNVFDRIKVFIGNVTGPGSGGQLLLDYFKDISDDFRSFDRDVENAISRKYFRDAAENTKIIAQSFSGLFRFLVKLGGNPAVGQFWENLQAGRGALAQLATNSVEAGPGLASILVNITKILAALSDSAQVLAFFDTLNVVFTSIASMLKDMKPLLDAFGPLIGTLSALGLIFLGFKKATLIIGGLVMLALKPLLATLYLINPAAAKATGGMVLFSTATRVQLKLLSASIMSVPVVGWIIGIVTALTAAGTALAMWSANTAQQTQDATVALAKTDASVADLFDIANNNSWADGFYSSFKDANGKVLGEVDQLKLRLKDLGEVQDGVTAPQWYTSDTAGQFERLGAGLQELAGKRGIQAASDGFIDWAASLDLTSKEAMTAYTEMDGLRTEVQGYAADLGVNILALDGTIDKQKEFNFFMQDAAFQTAKADIKLDAFNKTVANAVNTFIDINAPLQQNAEDVKNWAKATAKNTKDAGDSWKDYYKDFDESGFSLDYYLKKLQKQVDAAADYGKNLRAARGNLSDAAFTALAGMGKEGAGFAQAIASLDKGDSRIAGIENLLLTQSGNIGAQVAASFEPKAIAEAARKKYGNTAYLGKTINDLFKGNITESEALEKLGLNITDLVGATIKENPTELEAKWGPGVADNLRKELISGLNSKTITLTATETSGGPDAARNQYILPGSTLRNKNGGLIPRFKDGTGGGTVFGVGGPRADNIPAMLSVDEFVVNAAAARRNMTLLNAINSGNASDVMADAIAASSGGGSGTNIQINVNAVPNESVNEIVSEVERRLAFSYRKGVSV
jgi:hypothetical protein